MGAGVSIVTITVTVEMEFAAGVWTDVTSYVDSDSNLRWKRGVGADRRPYASTCSFTMDNSTEVFTSGNTSSAYFNKLLRGIGVRVSSTYSATTRYHFRGIVTDIRPIFPNFGPARMRVAIDCKGISASLSRQQSYSMALQSDVDVDDAADAIMVAADWALYDFDDSDQVLRYVYPRADPLSDIVGLFQSDPKMVLYEAGDGKLKAKSVIGGYSSPTHTWGATIVPDGDLSPDWRHESQFTRQTINVNVPEYAAVYSELYRHPFVTGAGTPERLALNEFMIIRGVLNDFPVELAARFGEAYFLWEESQSYVYTAAAAGDTTILIWQTYGEPVVKPLDKLLINGEQMTALLSTEQANFPNHFSVLVQRASANGGTSVALPSGSPIQVLRRSALVYQQGDGLMQTLMTASTSNVNVTFGDNFGQAFSGTDWLIGLFIKIQEEIVRVVAFVSATSATTTLTVARGQMDTAIVGHTNGQQYFFVDGDYAYARQQGSFIVSTLDAAGQQGLYYQNNQLRGIEGAAQYGGGGDIWTVGRRFEAAIQNMAISNPAIDPTDGTRYLKELVIAGKILKATDNRAAFSIEEEAPGDVTFEEGPGVDWPFGASDMAVARGHLYGSVRVGRVPTPWITTPPFMANQSDNVTSMLTAEIGDLVRWNGTGTWREKIDDYYRIIGLDYALDAGSTLWVVATLVPAHIYRNPSQCWFSDFTHQSQYAGEDGALGTPTISPPGGGAWSFTAADWGHKTYTRPDSAPGAVTVDTFAHQRVNSPAPAIVNVGSANMVAGVHLYEHASSNFVFPSTGGAGLVFRSNSAGTSYWRAFLNRSTSKLILWNTTDGTVTDYSIAVAKGRYPEIEVRCQEDRIRVFLDCQPSAVIDVSNTRFNTNTYAGIQGVITSGTLGVPYYMRFRKFYGQGL